MRLADQRFTLVNGVVVQVLNTLYTSNAKLGYGVI